MQEASNKAPTDMSQHDEQAFGQLCQFVRETALLAAMLVEVLEARHGARWWSDPDAIPLIERVGSATSLADSLVELGYDALDWRPVLRQIRTRLIGEMSGYGGPNITTRAGTRKV